MIPTRYKSKIPSTVSYPLGAKAISDALTGVPQEELLTIEFWFWKFARHGTHVPYPVLRAKYSGESRYNVAQWTIRVDAVPRALRHVVQGKLTAEALPKIRDWLISNVHSLDREGYHALTFFFDELKSEITSNESSSSEWETERV